MVCWPGTLASDLVRTRGEANIVRLNLRLPLDDWIYLAPPRMRHKPVYIIGISNREKTLAVSQGRSGRVS
jgi:hypothetical protein